MATNNPAVLEQRRVKTDWGRGWDPPPPRRARLWPWVIGGVLFALLLAPVAAIGWHQYEHSDRIYSGVSALGLDLSGMAPPDAERVLKVRAADLTAKATLVRAAELQWRTDWGQLGLRLPTEPIIARAMAVGREGNLFRQVRAQMEALRFGTSVPAEESFDEQTLIQFVGSIAPQIEQQMRNAALELKPDLTVELTTAQAGRRLDTDQSIAQLRTAAEVGAEVVDLPILKIDPITTDEMRVPAKQRIERILAAPISLAYQDRKWTIERQELGDLLFFTGAPGVPIQVNLNTDALVPRMTAIAAELNQTAQDAKLDWNGGRPRAIQPSSDGREMDPVAAARLVADKAESAERTIPLPVVVTKPGVDANNIAGMGLKEMIDRATTTFAGSVPQKAHNIRLAASRLHGVTVPPRALFSFNKALGPTTIANGYQVAFGITSAGEQHKTVPSVAGGICQVATTLFQPAFWSGYQLEERHWHLYWIPAYTSKGHVGLDATVDEEVDLDLQFYNNTDTHLLIQSRTDESSVTFELYGTKPAWEVKVDGPKIANRQPADNAQVTQPEPSLPEGQRIAVETAREGFTATFVRAVTESGGKVRTLNLESRYVPSRNVTLVGTGGQTPPPQTAPPGTNRPNASPAGRG